MESFPHDGDELSVTQFAVSVVVEQLEHDMDQVPVQTLTCACLHSPLEIH